MGAVRHLRNGKHRRGSRSASWLRIERLELVLPVLIVLLVDHHDEEAHAQKSGDAQSIKLVASQRSATATRHAIHRRVPLGNTHGESRARHTHRLTAQHTQRRSAHTRGQHRRV